MDLKSYFPDGLSEVHHDESNSDSMDSATPMSLPPSQFDQLRYKQMIRKMRDPPLLPPIQEVSASSESVVIETFPIHCYLCYRKILRGFNDSLYFKPCDCEDLFVHTSCALDDANFIGMQCSECSKTFRPKQKQNSKSSLKMTLSSERCKAGSDIAITSEKSTRPSLVCMCCQNLFYTNPTNAQRYDARFILPCFCGVASHHGCMVKLVKDRKACPSCGVKYRHFVYGSVKDYFKRYWCQYACCFFLFLTLAFFFCLSFFNSVVFTNKHGFKDITLFTFSTIFFAILIALLGFVIKYTVRTRLPRFRARYGHVTVVSYNPDAQTRKAAKRFLKNARSSPIGEFEVPLNDVAVKTTNVRLESQPRKLSNQIQVAPADNTNNNIEQGRHETDDLTLGQHMFGICNTYQSSSTPIENTKVFVFEQKNEVDDNESKNDSQA